jgi:hypothetical protein
MRNAIVCAVVLLVLAGASPGGAADAATAKAQAGARAWLALVDAGQYGESWDAAAELFRKSLTRKQWIDALTQVRSPLGSLASRKFRASQFVTDLPGAPSGEYVVIEYDSQFASGGPMIERITPMKDPDGVWRVSGYFVVPAK